MIERLLVAGIGVAVNAHSGVVEQNAAQTGFGGFATVGNYYHARMLRIANANATAMVERYPRSATGCVGH